MAPKPDPKSDDKITLPEDAESAVRGALMDRTRAHNQAVRHRIYRVILGCVVAVFVVATVVHLWSYWTAWKITVVVGLAVVAALIVVGIVFGRRILHRP